MKKNEYMLAAIEEAKKAFDVGEVPVGCIITRKNEIISRTHNLRETERNAISHAEILAINEACLKKGDWRLDDCEMYVTLEPCMMCTGAILNSRIKKLYFGAYDLSAGKSDELINKGIEFYGGICEEECRSILNKFFCKVRNRR